MKASEIKDFEKKHKITLPKDDVSEMGVIGSILSRTEYILKTDYLKPNQFYNRELGCIYHIVDSLYNKGITDIDTFTILSEIESNKGFKGTFEDAGVDDIVGHLEDLKLIAKNTTEAYELSARKVITFAFKRSSYIKLINMATNVLEDSSDINDVNFKIQNEVQELSRGYVYDKDVLTLGEQARGIWENIKAKRSSGFFGLPSKFKEVNKYYTYEDTEVVIIGAPGKTGKSQYLANEAWNMAMNGVPTLYVDKEMSTENHQLRFLAYLTEIETRKIKSGELTKAEELSVEDKIELIESLPYIHVYKPVADIEELTMLVKSMQLKHNIKFLVYDYVKANGLDGEKEHLELGRIVNWLKDTIAGGLKLPVLTATQMDDNGTKVADSQKIGRNCSTLCYLTRKTREEMVKDGKDCGNMKLRVKFNRNGSFMEDDEYINLNLSGGIARLEQAKIPFTNADSVPY